MGKHDAEVRQYLVVKRSGHWFAKCLGRFGVSYSSEAKAMRAALVAAARCDRNGRPAMVSVFTNLRQIRNIQAFGQKQSR